MPFWARFHPPRSPRSRFSCVANLQEKFYTGITVNANGQLRACKALRGGGCKDNSLLGSLKTNSCQFATFVLLPAAAAADAAANCALPVSCCQLLTPVTLRQSHSLWICASHTPPENFPSVFGTIQKHSRARSARGCFRCSGNALKTLGSARWATPQGQKSTDALGG